MQPQRARSSARHAVLAGLLALQVIASPLTPARMALTAAAQPMSSTSVTAPAQNDDPGASIPAPDTGLPSQLRDSVRRTFLPFMTNAGAVVTATLVVESNLPPAQVNAALTGQTVQLVFPPGLDYVIGSAAGFTQTGQYQTRYDAGTRTLRLRNLSVTSSGQGVYAFQAVANAVAPPANFALKITTPVTGMRFISEAQLLRVGRRVSAQTLGVRGGTFAFGRVSVTFPAGALPADTLISGIEYLPTPVSAGQLGLALPFDLLPDLTFAKPVTLALDLNGLVDAGALKAGQYVRLETVTPQVTRTGETVAVGQAREEHNAVFDGLSGQLLASLPHFSVWQAGVSATTPRHWKFNARLGDVNLFRGAATFVYPINVPAMQDGLQPALAVQYSSAAADQGAQDAPTLGSGWSLDLPKITRRAKVDVQIDQQLVFESAHRAGGSGPWVCYQYASGPDGNGLCSFIHTTWHSTYFFADDYTLHLNGSEYPLIETAPGSDEFVPEQYAPLKVRRCTAQHTCDVGVSNPGGADYWQVWTSDGVRYVFGASADSVGRMDGTPVAWHLRSVYALDRDVFGSRASTEYRYLKASKDNIDEVRLAEVQWGNRIRPDGTPVDGQYWLYVDYTNLPDNTRQVDKMRIEAGGVQLRRYVFTYDPDGHRNLRAVREETWNGASYTALPAMQFSYATHGDKPLLAAIDNGYGGSMAFTYEDVRVQDQVFRRVAKKQTTAGGFGGQFRWTSVEEFSYGTPCFNKQGDRCYRPGHDFSPSNTVLGFSTVTQRVMDGNNALSVVRTTFLQDDNRTVGRVRQVEALSPDGAMVLTRDVHEYEIFGSAAPYLLPAGVFFVAQTRSTSYPAGANGVDDTRFKRIETAYEPARQGGAFYGQATEVRQFNGAALAKVAVTEYAMLDAGKWLLRPVREAVTGGDGSFISDLRFGYNASGRIDFVQSVGTVDGQAVSRDIAVGYDALGNKIRETVFDDYGQPGVRTLRQAQGQRSGVSTTFAYDAQYGFFPVAWTNALGQTKRMAYYGVAGVPLGTPGGDGPLRGQWLAGTFGLPASETAPNGAQNAYRYDAFGRLLDVTRPSVPDSPPFGGGVGGGAEPRYPTLEYHYSDAGVLTGTLGSDVTGTLVYTGAVPAGLVISTMQRPDETQGTGYASAELIDGLGRTIQTRAQLDLNNAGTLAVTGVLFDPAGRAFRQSTAVPSGGALTDYTPPAWTGASAWPFTETQFDALGRPVQVKGPDGNTVRTAYAGYSVAVLDANQHLKVTETDALGRLVAAREYSGTFSAPAIDIIDPVNAPPYAWNIYGYDAADRLRVVTDTVGNTTRIDYDAFGQKTALSDSDMGRWTYAYDPRGRLVLQTDALGQQLRFTYDALDRVLTKACANAKSDPRCNGATPAVIAQFGYDETPNGIGQRTRMTDSSGQTVYAFDVRGRAVRETRSIMLGGLGLTNAGFGDYVVTRSYDNLDRPLSVTMPDGEVITTTHSALGPVGLHASQSGALVTAASYNVFGQLTSLALGNGLTTRYGYYGYNHFPALAGQGGIAGDAGVDSFGRLAQVCTDGKGATCDKTSTLFGAASATPQHLAYRYDAGGNILSLTDYANDGQVQTFGYDPLDRLVSAQTDGNGIGKYAQTWRYDPLGNITQRTRSLPELNTAGASETFTYDSNKPHAVTSTSAGFAATYDANGNMTRRSEVSGTTTLTYTQVWDVENRLMEVRPSPPSPPTSHGDVPPPPITGEGSSERYVYNADGERVARLTARGITIYVGELYEETWPASGPALPVAPTAASMNPTPNPSPVARGEMNAANGVTSPDTLLPAVTAGLWQRPAATVYTANFAGRTALPAGWDTETQRSYDCDNERLYNYPIGYNWPGGPNDFGAALGPDGLTISGAFANRQAVFFPTQPMMPAHGPLAVTFRTKWWSYDKPAGTTVYATAFDPGEFAIPADEPSPAPGQSASWTRDHFSARYALVGDPAVTHPACQTLMNERLHLRQNAHATGYWESVPAGVFALVTIVYTPTTALGTPDERGDLAIYTAPDGDAAHYAFQRSTSGALRPRSVILGTQAFFFGAGAWTQQTTSAVWVEQPAPALAALTQNINPANTPLTWAYPFASASAYQAQASTDPGFGVIAEQVDVTAPATSARFTSAFADGATVFFRVRALNGLPGSTEPSPWSNVISTVVDTAPPAWSHFAPALSLSNGWVGAAPLAGIDVTDAGAGVAGWVSVTLGTGTSWQPAGGQSELGNGTLRASVQTPFNTSGQYPVQFRACDRAGNCSTSDVFSVQVDVDPPAIGNTTLAPAFLSPNGDDRLDEITATADVSDLSGAVAWQALLYPPLGAPIALPAVALSPAQTSLALVLRIGAAQVAGLADGVYEVRARVTDTVGNAGEATLGQFTLDATPPAPQPATLYQPNKGLAVTWPSSLVPTVVRNAISVRGLTTGMDANGVRNAWLNGAPLVLAGQAFTATHTLVLGENTLNFVFEDSAGNQTTVTRTLIYTDAAPTVTAWGPTGTVSMTQPVLTATFAPAVPVDPASIAVTVDGVPAMGELRADGFVVTPAVALTGGNERPVRVIATFKGSDSAPAGQAEWVFHIDTEAAISLRAPLAGSTLNQTAQRVAGQTDPFATVNVSANGAPLGTTSADAWGRFELNPLTLLAGNVVLQATATDLYGHTATAQVTFTLDPSAPSAAMEIAPASFSPNGDGVKDDVALALLGEPPNGGVLSDWSLRIAGLSGAAKTWGHSLVVTPTLTWDGTDDAGAPLPDGVYVATLSVSAQPFTSTSMSTLTTVVTATVRIDRSAPAAPVIVYPPAGTLNTALPMVSGTLSPLPLGGVGGGYWVLVLRDGITVSNVTAPVNADGTWQLERFPLHAGVNTLTARAFSAAGMVSGDSAPVVVTVPIEPPLIDVGLAPDAAGVSATLTLTATARGDADLAPAARITARPREHNPYAELGKVTGGGSVGFWQAVKTASFDWCEAGAYCLDEVVFMGVDTLGNAGVATTTLALDYLPPDAPAITLPWNRTWVRGERVKVVGTAGEPFLTIEIAGGAGVVTTTAGADGSWQLDVPLSESQQQLMATAIDSMGNRSLPTERAKVVVRRDTQPPVVTPLPQAGGAGGGTIFTRRGQLFTLSATTNDAGLVRMTWADTTHPQIGVNVPLGGWNFDENSIGQPTAWARTVGPVGVDGDYSVTYRAIDAVGNAGVSAAQRLVVDSVAPVLTVTQITASSPFGWVGDTALVWRGYGDVVITTTTQASDDRSGLAASLGKLSDVYVETATSAWPAVSFDRVLQQFDRSGNLGVTSVRVANDLTPPALMVNGTARTTTGVATLNVTTNDAQSRMRGYDVSIVQDGITRTQLATNTLATQIIANGLAFGSVYVWEVTARDNVNNATFARFTVVSARATKTYYFGAMRVAVRDANVLSYLHSNHLSSVSSSTDANGKLIGVQLFAPYGDVRGSFEQVAGSWGWATHRKAEVNGLTYMRARWYLAGIGRFVQPDSIIPEPASPQAFNRYGYGLANPLKYNDPTGHDPFSPAWDESFRSYLGRAPEWFDRMLYLSSLAFPDEVKWNLEFVSKMSRKETQFYVEGLFSNPDEKRNWNQMPNALQRLSNFYTNEELGIFRRDVASLFAGLKTRWEEPNVYVTLKDQQVHTNLFLRQGSLPDSLKGDADMNVHHWGAFLLGGGELGYAPARDINALREFEQAGFNPSAIAQSDIAMGEFGAHMGASIGKPSNLALQVQLMVSMGMSYYQCIQTIRCQ